MADKPSDVVLAHYGVKGMKWGKRKAKQEARKSSDFKEVRDLRKRPASELSNKELKKLNERMNLEKNYRKLLEEQPKQVSAGKKAVENAKKTYSVAKDVKNFATSPMGKFVFRIVNEALKEAAGQARSARAPKPQGLPHWDIEL